MIGSLVLEVYIPQAHSLKEKRMFIRPIVEKIRNKFNVSVAEVDNQDSWQAATIAVVGVSTDTKHMERILQQVIRFLDENFPDLHINIHKEII